MTEVDESITPETIESGEVEIGKVEMTFRPWLKIEEAKRLKAYSERSGVKLSHIVSEGIRLALDIREQKAIILYSEDVKYLEKQLDALIESATIEGVTIAEKE